MPRGRPRKNPEGSAGTTPADAQQPKRRGRPPKDQQSPQPSEPKRGRGRPPKQQPSQEQQEQQSPPAARPPPPSYDSLSGAQGGSSSSSSSSSSKPAPAPPALTPGNSAASLTEEDSFFYTPSSSVATGGGGGVRWALALVAVALFPRAVAGTLRKLTGGNGAPGVDGAGVVRRNRFLAAFAPGPGGGPDGKGTGGGGALGVLGKLLTAGAARVAVAGAVASLAVGLQLAPPGSFQLYHTVGEIPAVAFRENVVLSGRVVRVSDGDTIRVRHAPIYPLIGNTPDTGRLTEETLSIRLAGIDAPEIAKAGAPGQPFSQESKQFVVDKVLNKHVRVKLLSRDQYARAVCSVSYPGLFWPLRKDLSEELVREGLAVIYRQKGAQYDGKLAYLETLEAQARAQRKGIWSMGPNAELPSQYKARVTKEKAEQFLAPTGG